LPEILKKKFQFGKEIEFAFGNDIFNGKRGASFLLAELQQMCHNEPHHNLPHCMLFVRLSGGEGLFCFHSKGGGQGSGKTFQNASFC